MTALLSDWDTPFELPPFDRIETADFAPAFDVAFAEARANISAIADNPAAPTFANTIEALEQADATLDRVGGVFFNLASAHTSPEIQALQRDLAPRFAAFRSEVMLNSALFRRVDDLMRDRAKLGLSAEQDRVLELTHRMFVRAGARLEGADRERLAEIMGRLATLGTAFSQNVLSDESNWSMALAEADLDGLPQDLIDAAAAAAAELGQEGHVITTSRSLIMPFLAASQRRDLREQAFAAWTSRGARGGETDNGAIVAETLALRKERAALLGYDSFAAFKLEPEMAARPDAVHDLLSAVWTPARDAALRDAEALTELMQADGINDALAPWDWAYYAEKLRQQTFDFDAAEVKPYFQLDAMIEAAFDVAARLFGLNFRPLDVPLYHPDARAWEVRDGDRHMGVFIGDYFARPSKRSGAWCSRFRDQSRIDGQDVRPIVLNVCNFAKPPAGKPALLTYDDARTLFHEFGHALHGLLSDVTYASISGTSVARDFVELPSQLYEHWLSVPDILKTYARHAETGEALPDALLAKLEAAENFGQGFATVEYVASAMVDLAFHSGPVPQDPMARQREVLAELGMPDAIVMRHATPHFQHVFSGDGYSSGYYSYMWSEVMDADAFAAFEETGDPFDPAMAAKLRQHIYSAGGSREASELYTAFRGAMPGVEALLRQRGLDRAA
ncbi:M3 family metallopeptidase [Oceanomicrobium pacificus]|uniref:Peptidase M3 n=1 Tax=Oceanomicrobium pacificus TaxID=2692916 RepID=A0A6B0TZY7_9RHOB|nr:M3 family metallopeptidase [Oceanomicrobium pacificus]MXU64451.1 peptidase M3 [Oceanomicrobium pacificus]